jgi:hypothetical protein
MNSVADRPARGWGIGQLGVSAFVGAMLASALMAAPAAFAAPPANDNFASATPVQRVDDVTQTNVISGTTEQASTEAGEPDHRDLNGAPESGSASVWFSYTSTYTEDAAFIVCTHFPSPGFLQFEPLLGVYTGSTVSSLTFQGNNEPNDCDGDADSTDIVNKFQAQSGTTYHFAVAGLGSDVGNYVLGLFQRPKNDDFVNATVLTGTQGQRMGDNSYASHQTGEPSHGGNDDAGSVWYRWAAPVTGKATFNTCGSEGDTVLAVYTGTSVGSLTPVVKNDNASTCSPQSRASFTAQKDKLYRIAIDSSIPPGAITLHYSEIQIPQTTITSGPSGLTRDATPTFKFSSSVAGSTFQCRFDAHAFAPCSGPGASHTPGTALTQGAHTFYVRAIKSGTPDPTPASRSFTVDSQPPQTTITAGPSGVTHDKTPTFKFASSEAGSTFQCMLRLASGGGSFGACSGPGASHTPNLPLANGNYVFSVRAKDKAGNLDPSPASRSFTVAP